MKIKELTLILFTSSIFFTTTAYAEEKSTESLMAELSEIQNKLQELEGSNDELKLTLDDKEEEISDWRATLENIEADIAALTANQ